MASCPLRSLREQKLDDKRSGDREQDEAQDNPQPCEDEAEDTMGFPEGDKTPADHEGAPHGKSERSQHLPPYWHTIAR
jgi:hypothetical protein